MPLRQGFACGKTLERRKRAAPLCGAPVLSGIYTLRTRQNKRTSERMSFCFGLRPPKAVSALRDFNARGRQSRPCAKVFPCGENACAAHSRRGPEGPFGGSSAIVSSIQNIDFTPRFQNKRTSGRMSFCFWFHCQKGGSVLRHLNAQNGRAGPPPVRWDAASGERLCGTEYGSPGKDPHPFWASICSFSSLRYTHRSVFSSRAASSSACRAWSSWSFT